jgi:tRNA pseudouridine55 synthase
LNGALIVDKPAGLTSHDVVNRVRRIAGTRRVGHLGTLDPAATGVLPLLLDRATRLAQFLMRADKLYDATIRFGYATSTYDREGEPLGAQQDVQVDPSWLEDIVPQFLGRIQQIPPAISAKKISGVPAYKLARQQKPVELEPVEVEIYSIQIVSVEGALARIKVHCSAGTYLRTLAHDLGRALGCGAHLYELRRLASGPFSIDQARTLEELGELAKEGRLTEAIVPAAELLPDLPYEIVDRTTVAFIRQGRDFRVSPFHSRSGARYVKAVGPDGELVAIGEARLPNVYHPIVVL